MQLAQVWVFNGTRNHFPSAVFTTRELAEAWIKQHQLEGTLTAYPLDVGVYDWAISNGSFTPQREDHQTAQFIANFSSAAQEHYHFESDPDEQLRGE